MTTVKTLDDIKVLDGPVPKGDINTPDDVLFSNIRYSIRLGHPQVKRQPVQSERVCIVGGGPSLDATLPELRELVFAGAKVVTLNGAYGWCLERNIRPSATIIVDARAFNARFVDPAVPGCHYLLASQCDPAVWAAVDGRPHVWIWHAIGPDDASAAEELTRYFADAWINIGHAKGLGGTTALVRGLALLRILGYLRFDLFGCDSCYLDGQGHAYPQPENDRDQHVRVTLSLPDRPESARTFECAGWHLKQLQCFLQMIAVSGDDFRLNIHGEGLLAYALRIAAEIGVSATAAAIADGSQEA